MSKRVDRRGRPPAGDGAMKTIVHLKLPDAAQENAIAREAVLLGIEVMRARRGKK